MRFRPLFLRSSSHIVQKKEAAPCISCWLSSLSQSLSAEPLPGSDLSPPGQGLCGSQDLRDVAVKKHVERSPLQTRLQKFFFSLKIPIKLKNSQMRQADFKKKEREEYKLVISRIKECLSLKILQILKDNQGIL